jgi:ABC-type nitrate/sulfonate/bicarbonate transport system permease component
LAEDLYRDAVFRSEKVRLQVLASSARLQVLDPALPTAGQILPGTLRRTVIAVLLGFAGAVVLAVAAGVLQDELRRRGGKTGVKGA